MRLAERNKQKVHYALLRKTKRVTDADGYETGEEKITYYAPVELRATLSAPGGDAPLQTFGILTQYQRTMICDNRCPIEKDSILWVDNIPDYKGEDGAVKHDYVVKRVYRERNFTVYLIQSVSVD